MELEDVVKKALSDLASSKWVVQGKEVTEFGEFVNHH